MTPNTVQLIFSVIICTVGFIPVFLTFRRHERTPGLGFKMQLIEMVIAIFVSMILTFVILVTVKTIISLNS